MSENKTMKKSKLAFVSNGDGTCYVSGVGTCKDQDIMIPAAYNGERVTGIGEQAFYKKSDLTSVTIPDSVTKIGELAFYQCTGLHDIQFIGTSEQWDAVSKGDNWNYHVSAEVLFHCRAEEPDVEGKNIPVSCNDSSADEKNLTEKKVPKDPLAVLSVALSMIFFIVGMFFRAAYNDVEQPSSVKIITFGTYEQDNDLENGKEAIQWIVLEEKDGKALIVSLYALDHGQYNETYTNVTWENCTLRAWLNEDFLNAAFSESEKEMIQTVTASADQNPLYGTSPGNETQDRIFLLSIAEVNQYFESDSERACKPTAYAKAQGAWTSSSEASGGNCRWWLRSPGGYQNYAATVYSAGTVDGYGYSVNYSHYAVRPALWVDLHS